MNDDPQSGSALHSTADDAPTSFRRAVSVIPRSNLPKPLKLDDKKGTMPQSSSDETITKIADPKTNQLEHCEVERVANVEADVDYLNN